MHFTGSRLPLPQLHGVAWSQSQASAVTDNNGQPSHSQSGVGVDLPPCPPGALPPASKQWWRLSQVLSSGGFLALPHVFAGIAEHSFDKHLRQAEGHVGFWLKLVSVCFSLFFITRIKTVDKIARVRGLLLG